MVKTPLLKRQARAYLRIADRQLAMAQALLEKEFYEGTIFHCYHAFESACSAAIANLGQRVPIEHKPKFSKFRSLYPSIPFAQEFAALLAELYPKRDRSLYADVEFGQINDPTLAYSQQDAEDTLKRTQAMVSKIRALLP
jgi:HEPN domain-containing protein